MKWLARYSGITVLVLAVLLLSTRAFARDLNQDEALALRTGMDLSRDWVQPARGWTDEEWTAAQQRLGHLAGAAGHRLVSDEQGFGYCAG